LILENQNGDLIDEVLSLEKWMAGDNQLKLTMERTISMQTWKNSVGPGGTPRAKNSLELDELDGEVDILPKVKEKIEENELNQETAPVYTPTELVDIGRRSIGDLVSVQGSAVVLPGVLGTQYFYVCDSLGVCLQIYSYTKDFPELEIGQEMAVTGELSQTKGEWRLKTKTKDDIFVLSDGIFMEPVAWNSQISVSRLVKVSGKIVDINGDHLFLANEQAEVEVFDKNKMAQNYFVGDEVELVGITALSGEKSVVLLLSVEKISLINEVNFTATSSSNAIDKKDNTVQASSSTFSWLTVFPWLFNLLLFGYLFKKKP